MYSETQFVENDEKCESNSSNRKLWWRYPEMSDGSIFQEISACSLTYKHPWPKHSDIEMSYLFLSLCICLSA